MTFFVEIHPFKGFATDGGPLFRLATIGFVTFGFAPYEITRKLAELTKALKGVVGK